MQPTPSRALIFFQKIEDLGSTAAYAYVTDLAKKSAQTDENEWREFKSGGFLTNLTNSSANQRQEADRRLKAIWSECLGAFANSGGGILIWGIKARNRIAEGVDLVPDAKALQYRLTELASDAVDPPVLGIEVVTLTQEMSHSGFVVCYIPQSAFPPHRSLWAEREYYFRSQDGNRPIPTAVLRRMFYPQTFPVIIPIGKALITLADDGWYHLQMSVDLQNRGLASAEDIAIQFMPVDQQCQTSYDSNRWRLEVRQNEFYFQSQTTIHPDDTLPWLGNCTNDIRDWTDPNRLLVFKFRVFARNTPAFSYTLSFTAAELAAQIDIPIRREAVRKT